jgi:hypothetical protein
MLFSSVFCWHKATGRKGDAVKDLDNGKILTLAYKVYVFSAAIVYSATILAGIVGFLYQSNQALLYSSIVWFILSCVINFFAPVASASSVFLAEAAAAILVSIGMSVVTYADFSARHYAIVVAEGADEQHRDFVNLLANVFASNHKTIDADTIREQARKEEHAKLEHQKVIDERETCQMITAVLWFVSTIPWAFGIDNYIRQLFRSVELLVNLQSKVVDAVFSQKPPG